MKSSGHGKYWKRLSNKKMRKMEITNGSMYKKNGYTYNIHDYSVYVEIPNNWKQEKWCRYFMCKQLVSNLKRMKMTMRFPN